MELLLLTFGFFFALSRLGVRSAYDKGTPAAIQRFGTAAEFRERHCDEVMEKAIMNMIQDEKLFDEVWGKIERSKSEYSYEINAAPDRELMIWNRLIDLGRRPLAPYTKEFRRARNFRCDYYDFTMEEGINQRRALHCLMWLQDKECKMEANSAWERTIKPGMNQVDNLANFDERGRDY